METTEKNKLVFSITLEELQSKALEKIGRTLTDEEIQVARKGLEFGLYTDINTVYTTIFSEMIGK
ncbi:MAG: hypothetical protein IT451_01525 [Candidatus Brocadia sp.]|nr:hypothetical protein [Candidatus Brocadia sp.]